jgi:hypothetical protein
MAQSYQNQSNAFGVPTLPDTPVLTPPAQIPPTQIPPAAPEAQTPPPYSPPPYTPPPYTPPPYTPPPAIAQPNVPPPPPRPRANNPPAPQQAPQLSIQQYLVSIWHGQATDNLGNWDIYVTFKPDGEFVQNKTLNGGQFRMTIIGLYNARLDPGGATLTMFPKRWQPTQFCSRVGDCRQIPMQAAVEVLFQVVNHDMFRTQFGSFQRVNAVQ